MFIPDATIKQILDKADIVAVIGEHIKLEKREMIIKGYALSIMIVILLYLFHLTKSF